MKIVFFGTPDFAKDFLSALHADEDIFVSAVVAQPDKPVGRKQILTAPATKVFAEENDIPVLQPEKLKNFELIDALAKFDADVFVIVAYGKIIPQKILDLPKLGNINVHPSKLPQYRGPSPLQATIAAGDKETAISIMMIDERMDHGPLLAQHSLKVAGDETPETLTCKVVGKGAPLLVETLKKFVAGEIDPQHQNHDDATFCKLLTKEDGEIDWSKPANEIEQTVRAYTPWPGTWTIALDSKLKVHKAQLVDPLTISMLIGPGEVKVLERKMLVGTGNGVLELLEVQPENKAKMDAKSYLNGNPEVDGKTLGA